jgi:copper chaperone NosL
MRQRIYSVWMSIVMSFGLWSCQTNPESIAYGHDECAHCRMIISDQKYGGELITQKGKLYKFDSIECMAAYYAGVSVPEVKSLWTIDFSNPGMWVKADDAFYLRSMNLPSPMGMFLSSYAFREKAEEMKEQLQGDLMNWQEVMSLVNKK